MGNKERATEKRSVGKNKKNTKKSFFENTAAVWIVGIIVLIALFVGVFFLTTVIYKKSAGRKEDQQKPDSVSYIENKSDVNDASASDNKNELITHSTGSIQNSTTTTEPPETTTAPVQQPNSSGSVTLIDFPSDTSKWKLICLNTNYRVESNVENNISLSYVAGSGERMDSRAAEAYEKMYSAAANDGIYLTPCSGYRSYSTQKRLYNEFVNEYIAQGYSRSESERLASRRRMPPGSSEHNIGICMDIITASSSDNFQNTRSYAWLQNNAADYGFILRYPADKVDVTGVKFEPWHWRYVGVENAHKIQDSGLCLEEYLGQL